MIPSTYKAHRGGSVQELHLHLSFTLHDSSGLHGRDLVQSVALSDITYFATFLLKNLQIFPITYRISSNLGALSSHVCMPKVRIPGDIWVLCVLPSLLFNSMPSCPAC